jgi:phosphoribosylpyrophosphate synthetase
MGDVSRPTEHVVPISLCVQKDNQLYDIVARYRDPLPEEGFLNRMMFLAATISRFYDAHAACLTRLTGQDFTMVTSVPSTRSGEPIPAVHPMTAVINKITNLRTLYRPVLWRGEGAIGWRQPNDQAFKVRGNVDGKTILIIDDIFVSGAHVQSAASALYLAGAASVTALVAVRLIDPNFNDNCGLIWRQASTERFDFNRCCLEETSAAR